MATVQQLLTIDKESETILLNNEVLEQLLEDDIKDDKIVVISVAGEFRVGKSFLQSILQKYLDFTYDEKFRSKTFTRTWMGNGSEPLKGFRWERGTESVTSGAQISKIFRTTLANGEKVVILLLDTQGTYDSNTSTTVNTKIFGLSTMVSSVQIFFVKDHIHDNYLKELKFFTDYGSLVQDQDKNGNKTISPYQHLLFFVRDWPNAHEYPYGYVGGEKYLKNYLRIRDDQKEELQSIRKWIGKFKTECFLMPHPGGKITGLKFDGKFSDLQSDYKEKLQEFAPHLLAKENLGQLLKEINGNAVTVGQFVRYLREYTNTMNSKKLPEPKDFISMNIQLSQEACMEKVQQECEKKMERIFASNKQPGLYSLEALLRFADLTFSNSPKYGDANITKMNGEKLKNKIKSQWNSCWKNKEKIDAMELENKKKIDAIELENKKKFDAIKLEVHKKDEKAKQLKNDLEEEKKSATKKIVLGAAMTAGACAMGIGAAMIAGPAVLVSASIFVAQRTAMATGAVVVGGGATVCVGAGIALGLKSSESKGRNNSRKSSKQSCLEID